jgi:hypothetical protein
MMRTLQKCCLLAAVLLLLGGCSGWNLQPVENLMRPPTPFGEYASLLKAFQKQAGVNAAIIPPTESAERAAVYIFDADWDGMNDSALLVYSDGTAEKNLRYALYYLADNTWYFLFDEIGYGTSYAWAKVADIPGYGSCQILICWGNDVGSTLNILDYKSVDGRSSQLPAIESIDVIQGEAFSLVNLDADKKQELFYVKRENTDGIARAWGDIMVLSDDRTSMEPWEKVPLDGGASGYGETQVEYSEGGDRLFVNAYHGANLMFTELIKWDASQQSLVNLTIELQTLINNSTLRSAGLLAQDVNNDGLLEIPVFMDMSDSENTAILENSLQRISWQQWDENGSVEVFPSIVSVDDGWILRTDKEPLSFFSFVQGRGDSITSVRFQGKEVFSLEENHQDAGMLLTHANKTITLIITSEGTLCGVTEKFIRQNLLWRL